MPDEGTGVNAFVANLTPSVWEAATANLHDAEVELSLPKFKLAWEDKLNDELQRMGMQQAFVPDVARFTRISQSLGPIRRP